jgi:hypothetical protein
VTPLEAGVADVPFLAADVFAPVEPHDPPVVLVCLPGGGMTRRYFDIDVDGTYSMARHLAAKGATVVTIDPPAVGESAAPPDAWALTAPVAASVCASAVARVASMFPGARLVGVGHSAGALLAAYAQAATRCFDALALLGFAGCGLPSVLGPAELALAGQQPRADDEIVALARARFGRPLPGGTTAASEMLLGVPVPAEAKDGISSAAGRLLAVVGGDHDITGPPHAIPADFRAAGDLTLYVLAGSGHNHNVAPTRHLLWDRLWSWVLGLAPSQGAGALPASLRQRLGPGAGVPGPR